jgi:regulator of protease activity HflC (stomatin/prohibitin superfamily)
MITERQYRGTNGFLMLVVLFALFGLAVFSFVAAVGGDGEVPWAGFVLFIIALLVLPGFVVVQPNESRVLTLFGTYVGSIKTHGFFWVNPFTSRKTLSLRVRNFETSQLKVNDSGSNPIEIGAIVVWRVIETAEASFEVDNYEEYVHMQSESALRTLAQSYPYDAHGDGSVALSTHTSEVSKALAQALDDRLTKAGVEVKEARISHLAYSPEIAGAMLQRQQAGAIVAARQQIVEGAVGMVETALEMLAARQIVELDAERKAQMVSNLLVVLCGDRGATPVVNAGSIHQ